MCVACPPFLSTTCIFHHFETLRPYISETIKNRRLHSLMLSVKRCDSARHSSTIDICSVSWIRMAWKPGGDIVLDTFSRVDRGMQLPMSNGNVAFEKWDGVLHITAPAFVGYASCWRTCFVLVPSIDRYRKLWTNAVAHLDLMVVGKLPPLHERKKLSSDLRSFKVIENGTIR